jgi:hypothetical protein
MFSFRTGPALWGSPLILVVGGSEVLGPGKPSHELLGAVDQQRQVPWAHPQDLTSIRERYEWCGLLGLVAGETSLRVIIHVMLLSPLCYAS